jgi:gliding motility-associated-like protein
MKKIFALIFLTFFFLESFAQLDTEHWFAPMIDRAKNDNYVQTLYFSTNATTAFPVTIYNNNIAIGLVMVSKGHPQTFPVTRSFMITTLQTDLFRPTTMGLYTKGEHPYFANFRFSETNHAEILTSKGKAGIGNKFYAAMAPITAPNSNILNFMTSVLATEDNTRVTVSGYQPTVVFSTPQSSTITFTLNKGQSYIIDGKGNAFGSSNSDGFIGAKIVANKPVSVTNGNFNGQYAGDFATSDILMDQSVPVERLGQEFALVKGNGDIGLNMEGGIIVATEDDTQIYLNDITAPIVSLNEGQYFRIPETYYTAQSNGVYNMYVKATKNVYLYQLLAGANSDATGGFNYIPPLSCYLPTIIDEIGLIDENLTYSNSYPNGELNIPTKLNIITEAGAAVTVNGTAPSPTDGPYPLLGNNIWVTYSIENVGGNITITSTKAVTAGIAAGDGAVGYGGYFAGFSSVPAISKKSGTCLPGIVLEVQSGFDTYQWFLNGVSIQGATLNTYTPTQPGNYTVNVTNDSCPAVTTTPFLVLKCPKETTIKNTTCSNFTIVPRFTTSTQNIIKSTIKVMTPPAKGVVLIDSTTGNINYTPNAGATGTDSFIYKFCGDGTFEECEEVTVNITLGQLKVQNATLTSCKINGTGTFNLSNANITSNTPLPIKYYKTLAGAQSEDATQEILNFMAYNSAGGDVYAVVKTPEGCSQIATITLGFFPEILLDPSLYNAVNCDNNLEGKIDIDFSQITPIILQNSTYFQVRYYLKQADALLGNGNTLPNNWSYSTDTPVFVRIDSPDNCPFKTAEIDFKTGTSLPLNKSSFTAPPECDDNLDGIKNVDLSKYLSQFTTDPNVNVSYYVNLNDAKNSQNAISNPVTVNNNSVYYLRLSKTGYCPVISTLNVTIDIPKASSILQDKNICPGTKTLLDAGSGFQSYLWSTGETTSSIKAGVGDYYVDLESGNGCTYRQNVSVKEVDLPKITAIDVQGSTVTITAEGGNKPYFYSLNSSTPQTSNVFTEVKSGKNTVFVTSADQCTPVSKDFSLIIITNVITPNGDNKNDTFNYSDLKTKDNPKFQIYDRYGKLVFTGSADNNYTWDGTLNNRKLPTASYWYILEWQEFGVATIVKYSGWVLLKNSNF